MGTRVLKAHVDAVIDAIPAAKIALGVTKEIRAFATILAEAVITATDGKTTYLILGRTSGPGGRRMAFGPYMSYNAAVKAVKKPFPVDLTAITIVPLYKHPSKGLEFA